MKKVSIGTSLKGDMSLWRYMSIDKFIDLLSNQNLFLTPLSYYHSSDPFEGFIPKIAFQATIGMLLDPIKEIEESASKYLESLISKSDSSLTDEQNRSIEILKEKIKVNHESLILLKNKISKSICVHCWYQSDSESEAMWKLYSDSGKGIAVKTSVSSLADSLNICKPETSLRLGRVKYLDFLSNELTPRDCVTDGVTSPLLKRKEYEHENEVRLYYVPKLGSMELWQSYEPEPIRVNVDVSTLIEKVYISPYVTEPFNSSVWKICELFGIPKDKVIDSLLLENYEKMLNGFVNI